MFACSLKGVLGWSRAAFFVLLLAVTRSGHGQILDFNHNGLSAVWELVYNAQGIDPNADSDGDGVVNRLEAVAGTDPFNPRSLPRISSFTVTNQIAVVRMNGALGKRYELQATEVIGRESTNWLTQASLVARTNPIVTLTAPADSPTKFFRIVVSDVDTDGDGLSDWEEYQLGLDPFSAFSNGKTDETGKPLSDYAYAMKLLNLRPEKIYGMGGALVKSSLVIYPKTLGDGTGLTGE